jgi:hypothetical protein
MPIIIAKSLFDCNTGTRYLFKHRDNDGFITEFCAVRYIDGSWSINNTYICEPATVDEMKAILRSGDLTKFDGAKCFFISLWEHNHATLQSIWIESPYHMLQLSGYNIIRNFKNNMIYLDDSLNPLLKAIQFKKREGCFVSINCDINDDRIVRGNFITEVRVGNPSSADKLQLSIAYSNSHYTNSADYCNIDLWRRRATNINV